MLAVSPDGRRFVYNSVDGLYLRSMDQLEARVLPGTEAGLNSLFFSPDGRSIAYFQRNQLKRLALGGGAPVVVCSAPGALGAHWAPDDTILFAQAEGILRVSANGGTPELVIPAADGEQLDAPQLLPDGDSVLFSVTTGFGPGGSGRWDNAQIAAQSLSSGERTVLLEGGSDARYVSSGHLVYALDDGLFAVPFDAASLRAVSGPVSMVEGVVRAGFAASANYAVSEDGTLFFLAGAASTHPLSWVDRTGRVEVIETGKTRSPRRGSSTSIQIQAPSFLPTHATSLMCLRKRGRPRFTSVRFRGQVGKRRCRWGAGGNRCGHRRGSSFIGGRATT